MNHLCKKNKEKEWEGKKEKSNKKKRKFKWKLMCFLGILIEFCGVNVDQ